MKNKCDFVRREFDVLSQFASTADENQSRLTEKVIPHTERISTEFPELST